MAGRQVAAGTNGEHMTNGNGMPPPAAPGRQNLPPQPPVRHSMPPPVSQPPEAVAASARPQYHTLPAGVTAPGAGDADQASSLERGKIPPPVGPKPDKDHKKRHSVLGIFKKKREKDK